MVEGWLCGSHGYRTGEWLCAFTTKCAVCILARLFPGLKILITIGAVMAVFPIFYAVIENDLRQVLCYSKINQIGFMVVGIGIGTDLAIDGAIAHAFTHVIYKGLLFMSMGCAFQDRRDQSLRSGWAL